MPDLAASALRLLRRLLGAPGGAVATEVSDVQVMVPVTNTRTVEYPVVRMTTEQRTRTVCQTVTHMISEVGIRCVLYSTTEEIPVCRTVCVPRQVARTVCYNVTRCVPRTECYQVPVRVCCPVPGDPKGKGKGCDDCDSEQPKEGPAVPEPTEPEPAEAAPEPEQSAGETGEGSPLQTVSHLPGSSDPAHAAVPFAAGLEHYRSGESSFEFFNAEISTFRKSLEKFTGTAITTADLTQAIRVHNENRNKVRSLYEFRKADPPLISGTELMMVLTIGSSLPIVEANGLFDQGLTEIGRRKSSPNKKAPR